MLQRLREYRLQLRALGAGVLLFASWLVVPVKLVIPEPVTCGMECCITAGEECCFMRSASHGGHDHDEMTEDAPLTETISAEMISSVCPAQCAQIPAGFQHHSIKQIVPQEHPVSVGAGDFLYTRAPHFARDALATKISSPRAPPSAFL